VDCFDWVAGGLDFSSNNQANTNIQYLLNGALGPYLKTPLVYKCVADQSHAIEGSVKLPRVRTLSMSQAFCLPTEGWLEDPKPNYYRHYCKVSDMTLPTPVNLWVLIDENPDSVNDAAFAVRMDPYGYQWVDWPSTLHGGGCGFTFADGHSEIHKWKDSRTLAMKTQYAPQPQPPPQPNNPDIEWVQDRTSAPK
jgi:prepilin-type processing-associated H-X9-DG protein